MTLGESLNLSEPHFPLPQNGEDNSKRASRYVLAHVGISRDCVPETAPLGYARGVQWSKQGWRVESAGTGDTVDVLLHTSGRFALFAPVSMCSFCN